MSSNRQRLLLLLLSIAVLVLLSLQLVQWLGGDGAPTSISEQTPTETEEQTDVESKGCQIRITDAGNYNGVQEAVDAAQPGAVIELSGICRESVQITGISNLTLKAGPGGATLLGAGSLPVILIRDAEQIFIEGLAVQSGSNGIEARGNAQVTVVDATISGSGRDGLWVLDSARVALEKSTISANENDGLLALHDAQITLNQSTVFQNGGAGLLVLNDARATLNEVTVTGNGEDGLLVNGSAQVTVARSTFSGNASYGLALIDDAQANLTASQISKNGLDGLLVNESAHATLTDATVSENNTHGLRLVDNARLTLSNSTVSENQANGLILEGAAQATLEDNTIEGNRRCGIFSATALQGRGNRMRDNGNDLCGNLSSAVRLPLRKATETEIRWPAAGYVLLQEAVDALKPGGVLTLLPEAEPIVGSVTLSKPLTLKVAAEADGSNALEIRGRSWEAPVFSLIEGAQVTFEGLTITRGFEGLLLDGDVRATLINTTVSGNADVGLLLLGNAQATLNDSRISENADEGLRLESNAQATLTDSSVSENGDGGLLLLDSAQATLERSTVSLNLSFGLALLDNAQTALVESTVPGNCINSLSSDCAGLLLMGNARATLNGASISENHLDGIVMLGDARVSLTRSTVSENGRDGLLLGERAQAILDHNEIKNNAGWGIIPLQGACADMRGQPVTSPVTGSDNVIEGNGSELSDEEKEAGDGIGDVCSKELQFLIEPAAFFSDEDEMADSVTTGREEIVGNGSPIDEIVWGGVRVDGIPALDNPNMIEAAEADYLELDDAVFGLHVNGEARAYPLKTLSEAQVVNDLIGDTPVVLIAPRGEVNLDGANKRVGPVHYAAGGEVRAYERGDNSFRPGADANTVLDATGRPWRVSEDALIGPQGETLARIAGHLAYWFGWFAFFPNTLVYGFSS